MHNGGGLHWLVEHFKSSQVILTPSAYDVLLLSSDQCNYIFRRTIRWGHVNNDAIVLFWSKGKKSCGIISKHFSYWFVFIFSLGLSRRKVNTGEVILQILSSFYRTSQYANTGKKQLYCSHQVNRVYDMFIFEDPTVTVMCRTAI
jgi:hypothetical protein